MNIENLDSVQLRYESEEILKSLYGENAVFREGQFEAIEATLKNKRTLVVQRTGWGKSLVYFTVTKLNRIHNKGLTIVVSPLLVLMQNQKEAAEKISLKCGSINSQSRSEWRQIFEDALNNEIDLLFVTPESLFSDSVQAALPGIRIGLFVIDEAHCISDWGHDFRLEYGNLYRIIKTLPSNVPVLGTTATANNRVISDLKKQWGENVYVSRGPLSRESLHIQLLKLNNKAERYAWILNNINKLPGCGIIYCLTQRDCDYLADFLRENHIDAIAYHSGLGEEETLNAEQLFKNNKIKVLVATIKLGMGYDKGDISYIIHFQKPSNIVSYYQQIGRAGRNLKDAYIFLMSGTEDDNITNYFINTAFPTEKECVEVLKVISENTGVKKGDILASVNIRGNRADKALNFLKNQGCIYVENKKYYMSAKVFEYDREHYEEVTKIRRKEYAEMKDMEVHQGCISKYIVNCLDDYTATDCGKCFYCTGKNILSEEVDAKSFEIALKYIERCNLVIKPRQKWVKSNVTEYKNIAYQNKEGICLCQYGDVGFGKLVKKGKYGKEERFADELVGRSVEVLRPYITEFEIEHLTYVPSNRSKIVEKFAIELSKALKLRLVNALEKIDAEPQKTMNNSAHQCENAFKSFLVKSDVEIPKKILLIDDIVDSRWTLTVCGYKLGERGCEVVFPFALADASNRGDD